MRERESDFNAVLKLFEFEKELGDVSASLQGLERGTLNINKYKLAREGYYDIKVFRRGEEIIKEIKKHLDSNKFTYIEYGYDYEVDIIYSWLSYLESEIDLRCVNSYPFKRCDVFNARKYRDFIEDLEKAGIKCGFIEEDEKTVSFVKVLESFRNCLHTLGIEMSKVIGASKELEDITMGICRVVRLGDKKDEAMEICKTFAENVIKNTEYYDYHDRDVQTGIIYGDEVQFKIGGAASHASILNLKKGEFRYEDHHDIRLYAVREVLENMGLSCWFSGRSLVCEGVDFEKGKKIAKLLAYLPSLDIYIDEIVQDYVDGLMEVCVEKCVEKYGNELKKECEEEGYTGPFVDVCIRERCSEDICAQELMEEAESELKIISAAALEGAVEEKDWSYLDVVEYIRTEIDSIIEAKRIEEV
ncbi:MAG TPA: hypothetical protein EYH22_02785 [Candidatus Nanopusillus sp.]|nr:hypothetical protein [Candidatus Nanopusillus sp.]